jgi:hypothetical protein
MKRRFISLLCVLAMLGADAPAVSISGQLLAYQQGYVFFPSGNGFRVAPGVRILDYATKAPTPMEPRPRLFARAVFDGEGRVDELDLSKKALPLEPLSPLTQKYVVAASPSYPDPELVPKTGANGLVTTGNGATVAFSGKPVLVVINVEVPPTTPLDAQVYMATDTTGWNPQALRMQRVDALHFRSVQRLRSGTIIHYVYTRGTLQTEERSANGLEERPRTLIVTDADVRDENDHVYQWADQTVAGGARVQPDVQPTPFNPAPFPNLPPGFPTPHPH